MSIPPVSFSRSLGFQRKRRKQLAREIYKILGERDPDIPLGRFVSPTTRVSLSTGACSLEELHQKIMDKEYECLVLGKHGKARKKILRAIVAGDRKSPGALKQRVELLEPLEPLLRLAVSLSIQ